MPGRAVVALLVLAAPAMAVTRSQLTDTEALYPRVLRLQGGALVASFTTFPAGAGSGQQDIYTSADGNRFTRIGAITDPLFAGGLCCGTLYELPAPVGALPAGTLLWAGSIGGDTPAEPMQIRIYRSADAGVSWTYLSNCVTGSLPRSAGGVWEPEFTMAADGSLNCFYSDETKPPNSQLIARVRSTDGVNWSAPVDVLRTPVAADRPGMPGVARLPGSWFFTYEVCGPPGCTVYFKTSADGLDWGDVANIGQRVQTAGDQWFQHTPTVAWMPSPAPNGTLLITGQVFMNDGQTDARNGRVVLTNTAGGAGAWTVIDAPVSIESPPQPLTGNWCQNYSSPLLPSTDGRTLLQFATDFTTLGGVRRCLAYFSNGALDAGVASTASLAATPARVEPGAPVTLTATVSNAGGAPGGSVEFYRGHILLGVAELGAGSGSTRTATLQVPAASTALGFESGGNEIMAQYPGTLSAGGANAAATVTVESPAPVPPPVSGGGGGGGALGWIEALLLSAIAWRRGRRRVFALGISLIAVAACAGTPDDQFTNPLLLSGPDPWITRDGNTYYYMHTMGDRLTIWRTRDITKLRDAEQKTIWTPPKTGPNAESIWAPELHRIDGRWYVYYSAARKHDDDPSRGVWVLENDSADPFAGEWRDRGRVNTRSPGIDGTTFEYAGKRYFVYSPYAGPDSVLAIARMSDPVTLTGPEVVIARPDQPWERQGGRQIVEGPEFLEGPKGDLFIVYSGSACWSDDYALGMLRAAPGSDPLDAAAWRESPRPVFVKSPENGVFAPGHNGFFTSPDGREHWIIYHANPRPDMKCTQQRAPHIQRFDFDADGVPAFGAPIGSKPSNKPSS